MAVTSWTSDGMTWPIRPGCPLTPYGEALRLALAERCAAAGLTLPALLSSPLTAGRPPTTAWGEAFDATVDDLIPMYVNHSDSGGDWDGEAIGDVAPAWTEAGLLAAIGAASRQLVAPQRPMLAAWAQQQYALLNLLRWTLLDPPFTAQSRGGFGATYAAAQSAFTADTWTDIAPPGVVYELLAEASQAVSPATPDERFRVNARRTVFAIPFPVGVNHQITVYGMASARGDTSGGAYVYDEPYYGLAEMTTGKLIEELTSSAGPRSVPLLDTDAMLISEPAAGVNRGFDFSPGIVSLAKWDVSGGFAFIA